MNLTIVLLLVTLLQVNAASYAQEVSLSVKNAPIQEVFNQLTKQTGYNFICDADLIKKVKPITISVTKTSLKDFLGLCFENQHVDILFNDGNTVVIKEKVRAKTQSIENISITITGKVTDNKGQTLPGVTVTEKGANNAVITSISGDYSIKVAGPGASLVFSFLGFNSQEVKVGDRTTINIKLTEKTNDLSEVVVVGYGSRKKADLTGAIATISSENLKERAVVNFGEAMAGQLAGVQVQQVN
ncbi:MAG TPA: carboxypeptidase-like regulatory domain-containing protein, partial [Mucilaginibacter sp.]|nr:carboxypeptidase-like regulatory domain-containing protein [Mucilaginibacter sp.]